MSLPRRTLVELMAYADDELDEATRARVEALARTSEEARKVLEAMEALGDVVREGVDARASRARVDGVADAVVAQIESAAREAITSRRRRARRPGGQGRGGTVAGAAAIVLALAAGAVLVVRAGVPPPIADGSALRGAPSVTPSGTPPASAAGATPDEPGVDLVEASSTASKVDVFFVPPSAMAGAAASVVVWIDDRASASAGMK